MESMGSLTLAMSNCLEIMQNSCPCHAVLRWLWPWCLRWLMYYADLSQLIAVHLSICSWRLSSDCSRCLLTDALLGSICFEFCLSHIFTSTRNMQSMEFIDKEWRTIPKEGCDRVCAFPHFWFGCLQGIYMKGTIQYKGIQGYLHVCK